MEKRSNFKDYGLWLLLALNAYSIYYYFQHPNSINTLIAIFWIQSMMIGVFTVIGMLSFSNKNFGDLTINNQKQDKPGCAAAFFAVHYGMFHFGYLIFLTTQVLKISLLDWDFIKLSFWAILAGCIMQFVQDKIHNKTANINFGAMFFMPYARIIPMHLTILLPVFFHISAPLVFLSLKAVADVIMHIVYRRYLFKPIEETK